MFRLTRVRHALPFILYALLVWLLLVLIATCPGAQDTSWLPATLWKYFPRPTPCAARVLGAATVALMRAMRARLAGSATGVGHRKGDISDLTQVGLSASGHLPAVARAVDRKRQESPR